ncbi:MAG: hypothetical protein AAF862_03450 [Pseudomonadota bacterium]
MSNIPQTFEEWEHCITVKCGIPLTLEYVKGRLQALENTADYQTQKFIEYWGEAHYAQTVGWFREAERRFSQ